MESITRGWRCSRTGKYHFTSYASVHYPQCNDTPIGVGKQLYGNLVGYPEGKDVCKKCLKFYLENWTGARR